VKIYNQNWDRSWLTPKLDMWVLVWCPENNWANLSRPIVCRASTYCVPRSEGTYGTPH
jgi:hypothetical protein